MRCREYRPVSQEVLYLELQLDHVNLLLKKPLMAPQLDLE